MNYIKIGLGIFFLLAVSRFVPHPPNFTSLIALSFYVPAIFGIKFLPIILTSYIITDLYIGFHDVVFFTWGSIIFIGLFSKYFLHSINSRIIGSLFGAIVFFLVTNFGVWSLGYYGYDFKGIILCYTLALPFFGYTLISTLLYSILIESIYKIYLLKIKKII